MFGIQVAKFLNKKTTVILFYKRLQTYFPIINTKMHDGILGGVLSFCICKMFVQHLIIKDILKKKQNIPYEIMESQ